MTSVALLAIAVFAMGVVGYAGMGIAALLVYRRLVKTASPAAVPELKRLLYPTWHWRVMPQQSASLVAQLAEPRQYWRYLKLRICATVCGAVGVLGSLLLWLVAS